jgi:uncharacterized protein
MSATNPDPDVVNDTRLNVAQLLMDPVGATRDIAFGLSTLRLDDDLVARDVSGTVRLTRLQHQLLADGRLSGVVPQECVRCLTEYDQPFDSHFSEVFRQTVDVRTGATIPDEERTDDVDTEDDEDTGFAIDESHVLDIGEAFRQWILLSLPMRPSCGPDCPGPSMTSTDRATDGDSRLAGLAALLGDDEDATGR